VPPRSSAQGSSEAINSDFLPMPHCLELLCPRIWMCVRKECWWLEATVACFHYKRHRLRLVRGWRELLYNAQIMSVQWKVNHVTRHLARVVWRKALLRWLATSIHDQHIEDTVLKVLHSKQKRRCKMALHKWIKSLGALQCPQNIQWKRMLRGGRQDRHLHGRLRERA